MTVGFSKEGNNVIKRKTRTKKTEESLPEIIVKFKEGGALEEQRGMLRAEHLSLDRFHKTIKTAKGARVRRSFPGEIKLLHEMHDKASRNLGRPILHLDLFVRVRLRQTVDVEAFIKALSDDPEAEYACLAGVPGPPPQTPDYSGQQDYQDPAPDGIDASYAWFFPGGNGAGIQVCDCEYGFNQSHEDLPAVVVVSNRANDLTSYADHGTAVLGELAARSDGKGVTGIGHGASYLFASETGGHRTDCITDAVAALLPGDVLILEMQTGLPYKPAEYDPDVHAAVTTAVGLGIVVVAAAGNGSVDLTTAANANGKYIWDPSSADFDDSGAVIVGAGGSITNADPHSKLWFSNYGVRVNCQGWGQNVVTAGYGALYNGGANAMYTDSFNGTSSATPIVAGAVACLQGAARQALGIPLSSSTVRSVISDPANGTPQASSTAYPATTYPIGPLPDLRRALRAAGIYPDIYLRDNVADTGSEPYMGGVLCCSPDIISRKGPVADPSADFGPAAWGDANLGENIEFGQDNYVYVRMHNRGNAPDDVTIVVYWTNASGFIYPATWNILGTLNVNNVLPGEHRVAGPIIWPAAQVPPVGHYCMIGVVNSVRDPVAVPGTFASVSEYLDFVRNHNNICYRNADVVDAVPGAPAPPYTFFLRGLPDQAAHFRLEIRHRLPKDAQAAVEVGKSLRGFERMEEVRKKNALIRYLAPKTLLPIKEGVPLIIDEIPLKMKEEVPVKIYVEMPKNAPRGDYMIYADQYLREKHLGRVNYILRVRKN